MGELISNILQLNDDCLYQIFRKLLVHEQLNLTAVCQRFRDVIIELVFKAQFRTLRTNGELTQGLTNENYQKLFEMVAPFIEMFTIDDMKYFAFSSYLGRYQLRPELTFYFCYDLPELRTLTCNDESLHDGHIKLITEKCKKLEVLRISSQYITGAYMSNIRNLHTLHAPRSSLAEEHLDKLLPQLQHLNIMECTLDSDKLQISLNQTLQQLYISTTLLNDGFAQHLDKFECLNFLSVKYLVREENFQPTLYWTYFGEYLVKHIKVLKFMNNKDMANLLGFLAFYLPILRTILDYLNHVDGTTQFICAKWLPKPTIQLHIFGTTYLPKLERLLNICTEISHIYMENFVIHSDSFKSFIFNTIDLLRQNEMDRQFLTIHLVVNDVNESFYKKLLGDIVESELYSKQHYLELTIDLPSTENMVSLGKYFNNIDFELV